MRKKVVKGLVVVEDEYVNDKKSFRQTEIFNYDDDVLLVTNISSNGNRLPLITDLLSSEARFQTFLNESCSEHTCETELDLQRILFSKMPEKITERVLRDVFDRRIKIALLLNSSCADLRTLKFYLQYLRDSGKGEVSAYCANIVAGNAVNVLPYSDYIYSHDQSLFVWRNQQDKTDLSNENDFFNPFLDDLCVEKRQNSLDFFLENNLIKVEKLPVTSNGSVLLFGEELSRFGLIDSSYSAFLALRENLREFMKYFIGGSEYVNKFWLTADFVEDTLYDKVKVLPKFSEKIVRSSINVPSLRRQIRFEVDRIIENNRYLH